MRKKEIKNRKAREKASEKSPQTHRRARMSEIQRRWKVGAYNYEGRRRRTVWHVLVREKENWHAGTAALPYGPIPRTARTKKQPSTYACARNNHPQ